MFSCKIHILVISVNIFWLLCPLQYRRNIKLISNFQRSLILCFDCPCGAAIWSGGDVSAKNAKQNKNIFSIHSLNKREKHCRVLERLFGNFNTLETHGVFLWPKIYRISSYSFLPWIVSSSSEETIQVFLTWGKS